MEAKKRKSLQGKFKSPTIPSNPQIGKAQARKEFLPLVSSLAQTKQPIEITEHGKPVAVLMDYESYQLLIDKTHESVDIRQLKGSVTILGDLEKARREINSELRKSVDRRSKFL